MGSGRQAHSAPVYSVLKITVLKELPVPTPAQTEHLGALPVGRGWGHGPQRCSCVCAPGRRPESALGSDTGRGPTAGPGPDAVARGGGARAPPFVRGIPMETKYIPGGFAPGHCRKGAGEAPWRGCAVTGDIGPKSGSSGGHDRCSPGCASTAPGPPRGPSHLATHQRASGTGRAAGFSLSHTSPSAKWGDSAHQRPRVQGQTWRAAGAGLSRLFW